MHRNSQLAHAQEEANGRLGKRAATILKWLKANPRPYTDREVAARLGYPDMNCVRPRITELVQEGLLVEVDSVRCHITGKTVRRVASPQPQAELPL